MGKLEAADALAGGVKSFLESLPFMAPEMVGTQAQIKLAEPLQDYKRAGMLPSMFGDWTQALDLEQRGVIMDGDSELAEMMRKLGEMFQNNVRGDEYDDLEHEVQERIATDALKHGFVPTEVTVGGLGFEYIDGRGVGVSVVFPNGDGEQVGYAEIVSELRWAQFWAATL